MIKIRASIGASAQGRRTPIEKRAAQVLADAWGTFAADYPARLYARRGRGGRAASLTMRRIRDDRRARLDLEPGERRWLIEGIGGLLAGRSFEMEVMRRTRGGQLRDHPARFRKTWTDGRAHRAIRSNRGADSRPRLTDRECPVMSDGVVRDHPAEDRPWRDGRSKIQSTSTGGTGRDDRLRDENPRGLAFARRWRKQGTGFPIARNRPAKAGRGYTARTRVGATNKSPARRGGLPRESSSGRIGLRGGEMPARHLREISRRPTGADPQMKRAWARRWPSAGTFKGGATEKGAAKSGDQGGFD